MLPAVPEHAPAAGQKHTRCHLWVLACMHACRCSTADACDTAGALLAACTQLLLLRARCHQPQPVCLREDASMQWQLFWSPASCPQQHPIQILTIHAARACSLCSCSPARTHTPAPTSTPPQPLARTTAAPTFSTSPGELSCGGHANRRSWLQRCTAPAQVPPCSGAYSLMWSSSNTHTSS